MLFVGLCGVMPYSCGSNNENDGGIDGGLDGGTHDAAPSDLGDMAHRDAGPDLASVDLPLDPPADLEFLDQSVGLGAPIIDANPDEAGNLWAVAPDALYIRRAGQTSFRRYTNADGLHIYSVITAVAGGLANDGYVGLQGVEDDDPLSTPPALTQVGKAEHVTLHSDGTITSIHYADLTNDVDPTYTETRSARRLLFVHQGPAAGHLFMGGNHGITHIFHDHWGDHVHVEVYYPDGSGTYGNWLGLAIEPATGRLWTCGKNACGLQEWDADPHQWVVAKRYDVAFTAFTADHDLDVPQGYTEDYVGAALAPDGTAWFLSRDYGLASFDGKNIQQVAVPGLGTPVDLAADPDGTLWLTDGAQLLRFDPKTGAESRLDLPASDIRRLYLDTHSDQGSGPRALYISTGSGLAVYRGQ